jgi:hypothetical protein
MLLSRDWLVFMSDRRDRYANSARGKIPPLGGGRELLDDDDKGESGAVAEELHEAARVESEGSAEEVLRDKTVKVELGTRRAPARSVPLVEPALNGVVKCNEIAVVQPDDRSIPLQGHLPTAGSDSAGTSLTFERVETFRTARADSREKIVRALRQLIEDVADGNFPWELLRPDYDVESTTERSVAPSPNRVVASPEVVVPLAKEIIRGRALVACPSWLLLMLFFLAATCLAMIAEQGLLNAGACTHFLGSKLWIFLKLGLVLLAALSAMAGLFHTLFAKRVSLGETIGVIFWPDKAGTRANRSGQGVP